MSSAGGISGGGGLSSSLSREQTPITLYGIGDMFEDGPLELSLGGEYPAVLMRTPSDGVGGGDGGGSASRATKGRVPPQPDEGVGGRGGLVTTPVAATRRGGNNSNNNNSNGGSDSGGAGSNSGEGGRSWSGSGGRISLVKSLRLKTPSTSTSPPAAQEGTDEYNGGESGRGNGEGGNEEDDALIYRLYRPAEEDNVLNISH